MPRCHASDVGFTAEGLKLGMPKRPAWRGVVHNGAELQRLEEKAFDKWCKVRQQLSDKVSDRMSEGKGP